MFHIGADMECYLVNQSGATNGFVNHISGDVIDKADASASR